MDKNIFYINSLLKRQKITCENYCTEDCLMNKLENREQFTIAILNLTNGDKYKENCELKYQLYCMKNNPHYDKDISLCTDNDECTTIICLKYMDNVRENVAYLDTGSQINVTSWNFISKELHVEKNKLCASDAQLFGVNKQKLLCLGTINLDCKIGPEIRKLKFYVLQDCTFTLIGIPGIRQFHLIIRVADKKCSFGNDMREMNIRRVEIQKEEEKPERRCVLLTPSRKTEIYSYKPTLIELSLVDRGLLNRYLYQNIIIYNCTCLLENDTLCSICIDKGPDCISKLSASNRIVCKYTPYSLSDILPDTDFWQGYFSDEEQDYAIKYIQAEPSAWEYSEGQGLEFTPGEIINQENNMQFSYFDYERMNPVKLYNYEDLFKPSVCSHCKLKDCEYYCNLEDDGCLNVQNIKNKIGYNQVDQHCTIITHPGRPEDEAYKSNCLFTAFKENEDLKSYMCSMNKDWERIFLEYDNDTSKISECSLTWLNRGSYIHFCFLGENLSLKTQEMLTKVKNICQEENITDLHLVNFNMLRISKTLLKMLFCDWPIKLHIYDKLHNEAWIKMINSENVAGTVKENLDVFGSLNLLTKDEYIRGEIKRATKELDKELDGLSSLFSKDTHDIGRFHKNEPPYKTYIFNLPIKESTDFDKIEPEKTRYIAPALESQGREMVEALLKIGVIKRSYSRFNAQSVWVEKPPQEKTLAEHLASGGTEDNYIAGQPSKYKKRTLRMTQAFTQLNRIVLHFPLNQPSPPEQIRRISADIKYISCIDITGCYHSLVLSKKSSLLTGFDSGIPSISRCIFLRAPMGCICSGDLQNAALTHCLSDLNNVSIYCDNLIVANIDKESHLKSILEVFYRLRSFGFKVKPSKLSLFVTEEIQLYGFIINLRLGKISPVMDKIKALRNRPLPKTRTELKTYLGGLLFYSQLLPLASQELALLNEATRGKILIWTDEAKQAFEYIQSLLANEKLIFAYRPNFGSKFYCAVDTSLKHTAFLVYQLDEKGNPRVTGYYMKTWPKNFQLLTPAHRELQGILHCIKCLQGEFEFNKEKVLLFTDSLPIFLMSYGAKNNSKLARAKLYIQSLSWLELSWNRSDSKVIKAVDLFTRKSEDEKIYTNKLPNQDEENICKVYTEKVDESKVYSAPKALFLIDSLLSISPKEIAEMETSSYAVNENGILICKDDGGIIFDLKSLLSSQKAEGQKLGRCSPVNFTKEAGIEDALSPDDQHPREKKTHPYNISFVTRQNVRQGQLRNNPESSFQKTLGGSNDGFYGQSHMEKELDISSFLVPAIKTPKIHYSKAKSLASKLEKFYDNFCTAAKYLDIEKLKMAQKCDGFFKEIHQACSDKGILRIKDKVFFLHKDLLLCYEDKQGIKVYKIIIPSVLSTDFVSQVHRIGHPGIKKLINTIDLKFEIRNISFLAKEVVNNCVICSDTKIQQFGKVRADMPKHIQLLKSPAICWYLDELLVISKKSRNGGSHKLIVAICAFSHFIVVRLIEENLTQLQFLRFINEDIIQKYGQPSYLVTDNAKCISGNLVKDACSALGIYHLTTSSYSARSNLCEMGNRVLLDMMRGLTAQYYCQPSNFQILITPAIQLINSLNFANEKVLSPHLIMFGRFPHWDIVNIFPDAERLFITKHEYLDYTLHVNSIFHRIRTEMINKRRYEDEPNLHTRYHDNIVEGCIVTLLNQHHKGSELDKKLRPCYRYRFIVIKREKSAAYIRPLDEITIRTFLESNNIKKISGPLPTFKTDISLLKIVKPNILVNSNKMENFYQNFLNNNEVPKSLYISNKDGGTLRDWEEVIDQEDIVEGVMKDLNTADEFVNFVGTKEMKFTRMMTVKTQTASIYKDDLKNIATLANKFYQRSVNQVTRMDKKVNFDNKVKVYRIIRPEIVFYCTRSEPIQLSDEVILPLRTIKLDEISYFCNCKKCRILSEECKEKPCNNCVKLH